MADLYNILKYFLSSAIPFYETTHIEKHRCNPVSTMPKRVGKIGADNVDIVAVRKEPSTDGVVPNLKVFCCLYAKASCLKRNKYLDLIEIIHTNKIEGVHHASSLGQLVRNN